MIDIDDPHDEVVFRGHRPVDFDESKIWEDDELETALKFVAWVVAAGACTIGGLIALVVFL